MSDEKGIPLTSPIPRFMADYASPQMLEEPNLRDFYSPADDPRRNWCNLELMDILQDVIECIEAMKKSPAERAASLKLPFHWDGREYSRHVWRGHRFVISEDARAVSRACADALRSVRG